MKDLLAKNLIKELENLLSSQLVDDPNESSSKLKVIVTGMEHSGTTFLSRLIVENSSLINSGFECGVLLSETPEKFSEIEPFYEWLCNDELGWALTEEQRSFICQTQSYNEFYNRLFSTCSIFKNGEQFLLDKTPAYSYILPDIIKKVPDVPVLVVLKDIELLWHSYKKRNFPFEDFVERFLRFKKSLLDVLPNKNVKIVKLEQIANYDAEQIDDIFSFINLTPEGFNRLKNYDWIPLDPDFDHDRAKKKINSEIDLNQKKILGEISIKDFEIENFNGNKFTNDSEILELILKINRFKAFIKTETENNKKAATNSEDQIIQLKRDKSILEKELNFKEEIINKINLENIELNRSVIEASSKINTLEKTILEVKSDLLLLQSENKNLERVFVSEKDSLTLALLDSNKLNDQLNQYKEILLNEVKLKNELIDKTYFEINNLETKLNEQNIEIHVKHKMFEEKLIEKELIILNSQKINIDLENSLNWYRETFENRSLQGIVFDRLKRLFKSKL